MSYKPIIYEEEEDNDKPGPKSITDMLKEVFEIEKCKKVQELDDTIREKILKAIYTGNIGLMYDIYKRCSNELFNKVVDPEGNGLISIAVMFDYTDMIKLLIKNH